MYKIFSLFLSATLVLGSITYGVEFQSLGVEQSSLVDIDPIVEKTIKQFNVPGLALGIIYQDRIVIAKGYGVRNCLEQAPVTPNTVFGIGSCTKAFTATILAQLVEEGRISWDDPVIKHVPEFRLCNNSFTEKVTIKDLIAHRTGIPRHDAIWFSKKMGMYEVLGFLPYLEPVCQLREKWQYNNFMYSVAGIVIERVTSQTWENSLINRIFSPLKMKNACISTTQMQKQKDYAFPYAEVDGKITAIPFFDLSAVAPGGAINASLSDMLKWVDMLLSSKKRLVNKNTWEELQTVQIPMSAKQRSEIGIVAEGYGLGWCIGTYKNEKVVSHKGITIGYNSEVCLLPEKNIGIVVLTNSSTDGLFAMATLRNIILDRLLNTTKENWLSEIAQKREKAKEALRAEKEAETPSPFPLHNYLGYFKNEAYGAVRIYQKNNHLFVSYGETSIPIYHTKDNLFQGQIRELLYLGIREITNFNFIEKSGQIQEVQISFEPTAKPLVFKRI